jgi:hypothetical protein
MNGRQAGPMPTASRAEPVDLCEGMRGPHVRLCRIEDAELVHAHVEFSMLIRIRQFRKGPADRAPRLE